MADTEIKYKILASVVGGQAIDGLKKSIDGVSNSTKGLEKGFGAISTGLKAFAAFLTVDAVVGYAKGLLDMGDELQAVSEKTGIASNRLFGFKVAASTANLSFEELSGALNKFSKNISGVLTGNDEVNAALKSLGVNAKDSGGKLRDSGDIIIDIAGKFEKLKNGPEKARLAIALFGKQGADLVPFLNQGSAALKEFGDAIDASFGARADQLNDSLALLKAKFQVFGIQGLQALLPPLQEISNAFLKLPSDGKDAISFFDAVGEAVRILSIGIYAVYDGIKEFVDSAVTGYKEAKALISGDFAEIDRLDQELTERRKKRIEDLISVTQKLTKNSLLFGEGKVDEIKKRAADETLPSENKSTKRADISQIGEKYKAETDAIKKFKAVQEQELELRKLELAQINYTSSEYAKLTDAKKLDIEVTKASENFSEANKKKYLETAEAIKKQRLDLIDLAEQNKRSFSFGAREGLKEYIDNVRDVASQTKQLFTNAFKGLEDAISSFVKTGKLSFTDLANSIIDDLIRIAIRQSITGPLAQGLAGAFAGSGGGFGGGVGQVPLANPFADGGIMTSRGPVPLRKYAGGGIARSPQLAMFGEGSTPEAYVPVPSGKIPVELKGGSGGNQFNISINVTDSGTQTQTDGSQGGGVELAKAISAAVQAELIKQKRAGGLLA